MHDARFAGNDVGALFGADDRIFEKTAGVAHQSGVGQLGAADGYHHVEHLLRGGGAPSPFGHFALNVGVLQFGLPCLGQRQAHLRDDGLSCQAAPARRGWCVFEYRIAVAKSALRGVQRKAVACAHVHRIEAVEAVLQFQSVSANVLYRRRAHAAGDERHVLQTRVALLQRPGHQVVPGLARCGLNDPVPRIFVHQSHAAVFHLQNKRARIAGEHDVAAPPQNQKALVQKTGVLPRGLRQRLQLRGFAHTQQPARAYSNAEGVVRVQRDVFFDQQVSHGR